MAGAAGGLPAVAGGVRVLRAVGRPGLPQRVVDRLRGQLRVGAGRAELPTAAVIDSQSVKAADTVGAATSGFDGGKKIKGRKRHVAVDSNGWLLAVLVTAASVQDRDAGHRLVALLRERFSTITLVWADGGYAGRLVAWAAAVLAVSVTIVKRSDDLRGFVVLPRRWVVERRSAGSTGTGAWSATTSGSRTPRGHAALGHHHDHDPAVGPPAERGTTRPRWGTERSRPPPRKIQKRPETVHQQALSLIFNLQLREAELLVQRRSACLQDMTRPPLDPLRVPLTEPGRQRRWPRCSVWRTPELRVRATLRRSWVSWRGSAGSSTPR